jgi:Tol biopolymer transport system component
MFGRPPTYLAEPSAPRAIHVVELETGTITTLPGSEGLFSPRWSPDGQRVAAMPLDERSLRVFDFGSARWEQVAPISVHNPVWARDGRSVYFQGKDEEYRPIYQVTLPDRRVLRLASATERARECLLVGLGPDGAPALRCSVGGVDLYALEWALPSVRMAALP